MNEIDDIGENNTEEINYGCCGSCSFWRKLWVTGAGKRCTSLDSNLYAKPTEMDDTCEFHSEEGNNENNTR